MNKKILFVDYRMDGHHFTYIKHLTDNISDAEAILPNEVDGLNCINHVVKYEEDNKRSFFKYLKWMKGIKKVVNDIKPDTIVFLYGDLFYRYFGASLGFAKKLNSIIIIHSVRHGFLNKLSLHCIASKMKTVVVHSKYLKKYAEEIGVNNVKHIEYPCFNRTIGDKNEAKAYFGISSEYKVLGCIGGTRNNKGLDILLEALKNVKGKVLLFVAGVEQDFGEEFIKSSLPKGVEAKIVLRCLSDEEFAYAIMASDYIVLPYRKSFNGASGPMGEGVYRGKCIIGPDYGNLGATIKDYHLGYVFTAEDPEDLGKTLNTALEREFVLDDVYKKYQKSLDVDDFINSYEQIY